MKEVCVILPALNEEHTIGLVIDEIPVRAMEEKGYRTSILVVNNGSTDRTEDVAREKGVAVITEPRKGKGMALKAGFAAAKCDFVFMLDSDFTYPATHIPEMLELLEGDCDVVLGSRIKGHIEDGAMTSLNRVGNRLLAIGFDIEVNMLTEVARNGFSMAEVPIGYRKRKTRPKLNSLRDGFRIGKTLVRRRFRSR